MAKKPTSKPNVKKKVYRFYGMYNNIHIGPSITLNGVKIIQHEVAALNLDEAVELYRLHIMKTHEFTDKQAHQYMIDLYYKSMKVEIIDTEGIEFTEVPLG